MMERGERKLVGNEEEEREEPQTRTMLTDQVAGFSKVLKHWHYDN